MPRTKVTKAQKAAAQCARAGRAAKTRTKQEKILDCLDTEEECTWTGDVMNDSPNFDSDGENIISSDAGEYMESGGSDIEILEGDDVVEGLRKAYQIRCDLEKLAQSNSFESIMTIKGTKEWKKAEAKRSLGYNGLSDRTHRHKRQKQQENEASAAVICET
jgi:hypothetical protein